MRQSFVGHGLPECTRPAFDVSMSSRQIDAEVRRRLKAASRSTKSTRSYQFPRAGPADHAGALPGVRGHAGGCRAGRLCRYTAGDRASGRRFAGHPDGIFSVGRALGREPDAAKLVDTMKSRIGTVSRAVRHRRAPRLSRSSGPTPCLRWATGVPSSSRRPMAGFCWAEKENIPRPSTGAGVRRRPGMACHRAVRFRPGRTLARGAATWKPSGLVRPASGAPRPGGLADGNMYFNRSGTTIVQTVEILAEILHRIPGRPRGHRLDPIRSRLWEASVRSLHADACARSLPSYADPSRGTTSSPPIS